MKTIPRDISIFRSEMRELLKVVSQSELAALSGVSQGSISNFVNQKRGLSGDSVLKLLIVRDRLQSHQPGETAQ